MCIWVLLYHPSYSQYHTIPYHIHTNIDLSINTYIHTYTHTRAVSEKPGYIEHDEVILPIKLKSNKEVVGICDVGFKVRYSSSIEGMCKIY